LARVRSVDQIPRASSSLVSSLRRPKRFAHRLFLRPRRTHGGKLRYLVGAQLRAEHRHQFFVPPALGRLATVPLCIELRIHVP